MSFEMRVDDPAGKCLADILRHVVGCHVNEGSQCVSMTWRGISAHPYPEYIRMASPLAQSHSRAEVSLDAVTRYAASMPQGPTDIAQASNHVPSLKKGGLKMRLMTWQEISANEGLQCAGWRGEQYLPGPTTLNTQSHTHRWCPGAQGPAWMMHRVIHRSASIGQLVVDDAFRVSYLGLRVSLCFWAI